MAGNSTTTLQQILDDAATLGDVSPALATGGFSDGPALSMANDVMAALLLGGPAGQPFNWKWNRINITPFVTISYQQDYFVPGVVNLGWLEDCSAININQASVVKSKFPIEVRRDLPADDSQGGYPRTLCWLPNDQLQTGKWGQHPLGPTAALLAGETGVVNPSIGMQNPGPSVIYTNPLGALQSVLNATTAITDPNGNLWALTTFGTCGTVQPTWPISPSYPTLLLPNTVATTVADGTCVWTAINPKGQGFRMLPVPPQTGYVWRIQPIAQMRVPTFKTLAQTLEPVPDDYVTYFKQGFFAECYRRNPDPNIRSKYAFERQLWMEALDKAIRQGQRELDVYGFFPGSPLMDSGFSYENRPDQPYGP